MLENPSDESSSESDCGMHLSSSSRPSLQLRASRSICGQFDDIPPILLFLTHKSIASFQPKFILDKLSLPTRYSPSVNLGRNLHSKRHILHYNTAISQILGLRFYQFVSPVLDSLHLWYLGLTNLSSVGPAKVNQTFIRFVLYWHIQLY